MNIATLFPPRFLRGIGMLLVVVGALQLAGCATYIQPRLFTTEAETLAAKGEPSRRWQNDDGTTTLEYATQPYGYSCLMVQVDQGGVVLRQWDALDSDNLAQVKKGMTREEVERTLGQHRSEQIFKLSGEEVWDWNIRNRGPGIATLFNVHFIDGKVARTSQSYVYPREGPMAYGYWGHGYPYYRYPYYRHPFFAPHPFFPYWW
ncbi:hypothetical protein [Thauera linaloolentis]|uniref:Lipoprotein n=1 Tax=Thauera linaloolentis (strain DSM 12138 / JCM 21573 / CCUG 41526 / CIP 105981 / IAM 15112 / NBRC 102519 / 47Lol) TaxID=1123367 RepID=N6Z7A4_THAL4|nr:hypothetical protein [Thauera linaloolentis]ENO88064.1 hypothetical protein C666_09660 [Thauera linaloolentis 47Lol = DSM 12138]MCM8565202.1 outer membrane protein assembly factor BamE [Thauera linaloolentis]